MIKVIFWLESAIMCLYILITIMMKLGGDQNDLHSYF